MVRNLFIFETITTTLAKAKEARRLAEKTITLTKEDSLTNKRAVYRILKDHKLTALAFKEIGPRFKERAGGYTRIVHLDTRAGDGAKRAILSLVELKPKKTKAKTAEEKKRSKPVDAKEQAPKAARKEKKADIKPESKKAFLKAAKGDSEEKNKGFLKGLRGYLKKGGKTNRE